MQLSFASARSSIALAVAAALLSTPSLLAQAPSNDDCANAIPVVNGTNGPFTNVGATPSTPAWPCVGGGGDVWFSYVATCDGEVTAATCGGTYDSAIEAFSGTCGSLVSLGCNDDFCSLQSSVTFPVTAGQTYYIRVGAFSTGSGTFPLEISCDFPFGIEGTAEATPGSGTLGPIGGAFMDGYDLRWNYVDPLGLAAGKVAATVANLGPGCEPPVGVTAAIPGFVQVWGGSTPPGLALVFPIGIIPTADQTLTIPAGLFFAGDKIRMQAVLLDAANAPGSLPIVPSQNTIQFVHAQPVIAGAEDFETVPTGVGNYPTGWSNGGGIHEWRVDSGGTPSSGTGPSAAFSGANYMYCETSFPVVQGDTFLMNTAVYPSAGLRAVSFALSRVGDAIGTLEVRMGDGSGTFPTLLCSYSGNSPAEWTEEVIALDPTGAGLPANVQFQFHYSAGPSFRGDLAIDLFGLQ